MANTGERLGPGVRAIVVAGVLAIVGGPLMAAVTTVLAVGMSFAVVAAGTYPTALPGASPASPYPPAPGPAPWWSAAGGEGMTRPIPSRMLALYRWAAPACPGLRWEVLAGIGRVETDHDRADGISSAGAEGPMQFMPATFAAYGIDSGDGDAPNIWDPADAVLAAARYLCANGGGKPGGLRGALWAYDHSPAYVSVVLSYAARYTRLYG